jgi:hypothetical protein
MTCSGLPVCEVSATLTARSFANKLFPVNYLLSILSFLLADVTRVSTETRSTLPDFVSPLRRYDAEILMLIRCQLCR